MEEQMDFTKSRKEAAVDFPEDIMLNILIRLPVKSVGRFRCVSKYWCKYLKDNPRFVKMHLQHATTEMNEFKLMLFPSSDHRKKDNIYTLSYGSPSSLNTSSVPTIVDYPFKSEESDGIGLWGSCNGLVCFSSTGMVCLDMCAVDIVVVWNPSTDECQKLPPTPIVGKPDYIEYGFGYDSKIDDFKVVSLVGDERKCCCQVHVYTLGGSNTWVEMSNIPYGLSRQRGDIQEVPDMGRLPVNGAIHWIAFRESGQGTSKVILSFNFEKQVFTEMQLLSNMLDEGGFKTNLCVLEGSLCVLQISKIRVHLWELKSYGVENSWTKLFSIDVEQLFRYVGYLIPLRRFENGEILLGFDRDGAFNMGLYNSEHQTFKMHMVYGNMVSYSGFTSIYVESLYSPRKGSHSWPAEAEEIGPYDDEKFADKWLVRSATKENKPRLCR